MPVIQPVKSENCLNLNFLSFFFFKSTSSGIIREKYNHSMSLYITVVFTHQEGQTLTNAAALTIDPNFMAISVQLISAQVDGIAITGNGNLTCSHMPLIYQSERLILQGQWTSLQNFFEFNQCLFFSINISVFIDYHPSFLWRTSNMFHIPVVQATQWHHLSLSGQDEWFHPHICVET